MLTAMEIMFDRLKNINSHTAYFLLKHCFTIPKFTYFKRISAAWKFEEFLKNVRKHEGKPMATSNFTSASGRFGNTVEDIALPDFLSSTYGASNLVSHIMNKPEEIAIHSTEAALNINERFDPRCNECPKRMGPYQYRPNDQQ